MLLAASYAGATLYVADTPQRVRQRGRSPPAVFAKIVTDVRRAAKRLLRGRRARGPLGPVPEQGLADHRGRAASSAGLRRQGDAPLEDMSLADLDRGDAHALDVTIHLTHTSDTAATPTIARFITCVFSDEPSWRRICPYSMLANWTSSAMDAYLDGLGDGWETSEVAVIAARALARKRPRALGSASTLAEGMSSDEPSLEAHHETDESYEGPPADEEGEADNDVGSAPCWALPRPEGGFAMAVHIGATRGSCAGWPTWPPAASTAGVGALAHHHRS